MSSNYQNRGGNRRGGNFNKGGGGRHGGGGAGKRGGKDTDVPVDEKNPVIQCFREYAQELDEKHDRYERIVKCSRDITIESKRIIFLLHTVDAKKNNQSRVCKEAQTRLQTLCRVNFATIARELHKQDPYQFLRAYTAGLQEFIEAYTFCEYVKSQSIIHWTAIQDQLKYKLGNTEETDSVNSDETDEQQPEDEIEIVCPLPPLEFFLGVGDLTGEVMRKCINSLGSGEVESCFEHCRFLQELYKGFISLNHFRSRDLNQKVSTLRQSLLKSESVCYNVKVRGGEAAKWSSTDVTGFLGMSKDNPDLDEGVFF